MQLQVEQWREIVPKTKEGVLSYLGSGLIKGIGKKTAAEIVAKVRHRYAGHTGKAPGTASGGSGDNGKQAGGYPDFFCGEPDAADIMTLLAPFKLTPKTALKIYQHFGPACMDLLKKKSASSCARYRALGFGGWMPL